MFTLFSAGGRQDVGRWLPAYKSYTECFCLLCCGAKGKSIAHGLDLYVLIEWTPAQIVIHTTFCSHFYKNVFYLFPPKISFFKKL